MAATMVWKGKMLLQPVRNIYLCTALMNRTIQRTNNVLFKNMELQSSRSIHGRCQSMNSSKLRCKPVFRSVPGLSHHRDTTLGRGLAMDSSTISATELRSKIDDIAEQFIEARELLEDARDVKGTVYFSGDMKEAADAVNNTLKEYEQLLSKLDEAQKQEVLRTIGLKMEELKAQKEMLEEESLAD